MLITLIFIGILLVAALGGWFLARGRNEADEERKQLRVMAFVLYFWVLVFVQVILAALVYSIGFR